MAQAQLAAAQVQVQAAINHQQHQVNLLLLFKCIHIFTRVLISEKRDEPFTTTLMKFLSFKIAAAVVAQQVAAQMATVTPTQAASTPVIPPLSQVRFLTPTRLDIN